MGDTHGDHHWLELNTRDPEASCAFYARLLGWAYEDMPMESGDTYRLIMNGKTMVGGVFQMDGPDFEGVPDHWFTYFAVRDADAAAAAVTEAGGRVVRPAFDVPEVGRILIVADATGAMLGLMQPAPG